MAVRIHLWQSLLRMSAFCRLFFAGWLLFVGTAEAQPEPAPPAALASVEELAKRVRPSVVVVMSEGREGRQQGLGTGNCSVKQLTQKLRGVLGVKRGRSHGGRA